MTLTIDAPACTLRVVRYINEDVDLGFSAKPKLEKRFIKLSEAVDE